MQGAIRRIVPYSFVMAKRYAARLKLNSRLVPICVILLLVLQLTVPYRGWVVLFVGLGGAWLVAYLWARSLARGLRLVREVRFGWAQVGDRLEERFTLVHRGWAPALWAEIVDHSTLPGYTASRATGLGGDSESTWTVKGVCTRRGVYTLGPTTLRTGDPFGLYTVSTDYAASTTMVVMPPIVPLTNVQVAPGGRAGEGQRRIGSFERTVNAAGVREYAPGDSLSWVHWRTFAHRDELYVRLFDSTPSSDWWIVLDLNQSVQAGQGQDSTIEHGVVLAASLADRGMRLRRAVGLVACGESLDQPSRARPGANKTARQALPNLIWLTPQESESRRWEILRALALAVPGTCALADLLAQIKPSFKGVSSLIVITPDVRGAWIKSLLPFRWRGVEPTIILLDPSSFGGTGDARAVGASLTDLDIAHHIFTRDMLDRPELRPGREGQWDWSVSPRGRAIAKRGPRNTAWRVLS